MSKKNNTGLFHIIRGMIICCAMICVVCLTGCAKAPWPVTASVVSEDHLKEIDLEYGDSVNVSFSGGYEEKGLPFYPDFFGRIHTAVLTDYFDTISVAGIGYSFNNHAGVRIGEEVKISLEEKGRYREEYEAYSVPDGAIQAEGQSDEAFRNAHEVTAGRIAEKRLYRGSSPFDQRCGRVGLMGQYMEDNGILCVLDLSDTQEKLQGYTDLPEHTTSMIADDQVIACSIGVDYADPVAMQTLGQGLARMSEMEGPYLVQCNLGRDRTGVVCALLEALCGASYQEIVDDYMISYDKLHGVDMNPETLQYRLFKQRIDDQMNVLFGIAIDELPESDLAAAATDYLTRCGMTKAQTELLRERLTRE